MKNFTAKDQIMDVKEITSAIMFGNLNNEQLTSVIEAVKYARAQLTKTTARALRSGDTVKFTDRNGRVYSGTVDRVKLKYVLVNTSTGRYNVPANLLEAV
jgi:hypothetical protein